MNEFLVWLRKQMETVTAAPRYLQLATSIQTAIEQHILSVGDFLPPERTMAEYLGVSRVTVGKALSFLEERSVVSRQQGRGTRVRMHLNCSLGRESGFTIQVVRRGCPMGNRWLLRTRVIASDRIADALQLKKQSEVVKIRRLRLMNDAPVSLETTYIPPQFLPEPEQLEYSLYELWKSRGIVPERKLFRLNAIVSDEKTAPLLDVAKGTPLMRIMQTSSNHQGTVLEFSESFCRGDVFEFIVNS